MVNWFFSQFQRLLEALSDRLHWNNSKLQHDHYAAAAVIAAYHNDVLYVETEVAVVAISAVVVKIYVDLNADSTADLACITIENMEK